MRESAKPRDDIQMPPSVFPVARITDPLTEKTDRKPLVFDVLRVFERQIAEQAMVIRRVGVVEPQSKNLPRHAAGPGIGDEGLGGAAENVPRDLVEKNA